MNKVGVGKSPLVSPNRLMYIPPSIHRTRQVPYDHSNSGVRLQENSDAVSECNTLDHDLNEFVAEGSPSSDGILTLFTTTYSLLVVFFLKSLLDRIRPIAKQTQNTASADDLVSLQTGLPQDEPKMHMERSNLNKNEDGPSFNSSLSSQAYAAEASDILPQDLLGFSALKNNYANLYESMFEVDSDDEVLDLNAQYGTSLRISENSNYTPQLGIFEAASNEHSLQIHSFNGLGSIGTSFNPLDSIDTSAYFVGEGKANTFGSASFIQKPDPLFNLEPSDDYDDVVSKFYTPFKPVPRKQFSLTDAIMASIPSSSLSSFLRRERECIQDLILNERKAKLSGIIPLSPQQTQLVERYWSSRQTNNAIVSAYSIDITVRDLNTLSDGRWLNDNVIDFYLSMVSERFPCVYCWTTHFFTTLKSKGYQGVARWSRRRKVNVTEKSLVVVPINVMSTHWAMAVIDNVAATISYYDSLASRGNLNAVQLLQKYMMQESERLQVKPIEYTLKPNMETPQQLNGFDCGVFSCTVAKFISSKKPLLFGQNDMPAIRRRMAYEIIQKTLLENNASHL